MVSAPHNLDRRNWRWIDTLRQQGLIPAQVDAEGFRNHCLGRCKLLHCHYCNLYRLQLVQPCPPGDEFYFCAEMASPLDVSFVVTANEHCLQIRSTCHQDALWSQHRDEQGILEVSEQVLLDHPPSNFVLVECNTPILCAEGVNLGSEVSRWHPSCGCSCMSV